MSKPRLIRKYVNRRLYDTESSRYVNLGDLREMILNGDLLQVVDQRTERDITHSVLLQILADVESGSSALLDPEILADLIRRSAAAPDPGLPARIRLAVRGAISSAPRPAEEIGQSGPMGISERRN